MVTIKELTYTIAAVLAAVILIISTVGGGAVARAATAAYPNTNVLNDLQNDENFSVSDYPDNAKDYSIKVIQVAESTDGRLLVYTYQPSQKTKYLVATDINMSLSEDVQGTKLYSLILLNTSGVFGKYQVQGISVENKSTRIYNVTSIYRAYDKDIDTASGNNNTIDKKAFAVSKVFKVTTENGELNYSVNKTQVVEIINPYSDYLIYTKSTPAIQYIPSVSFSAQKYQYFDCHYIAFSTDWEIDRLMSAEVHYYKRTGEGSYDHFLLWDFNADLTYGPSEEAYATPTYLDRVALEGSGHFGTKYKYNWDRIQTVAEFIEMEKGLTDETKENLNGKQWVLRFAETERTQTETGVLGYKKYNSKFTKVDRVSILRLEFETDGVIYNLGAVSDTVSGDEFAGNAEKGELNTFGQGFKNLWNTIWNKIKGLQWWQWLLIGLGAVLLVGLIISLITFGIKAVCSLIVLIIKKLLIGLWWLFCLPFKLIAKLFTHRQDKAANK